MSNKMTAKNGEFCWNELMTTDPKKANQFYQGLFGWESDEHQMPNHPPYTMYKSGETGIGGMMQIPADKEAFIPPHWLCYINVDDLDATLEKAKSLGAQITVPKTPVKDFGQFAIIQDPSGAHVGLWQSLKK